MLRFRSILLFVTVFIIAQSLNGQKVVSVDFITAISKEQLKEDFNTPIIQYGVEMYKVLYETNDIKGALDTASGLFIIPDDRNKTYPFLISQHGTVDNRWDVPSNLGGGYQLPMLFGSMGYATVAPDYLGLGESRGIHPYVHAESQAWVAIDMLFAAKDYSSENGIAFNDQLFITGYSQGGHAAAAVHRAIERDYAGSLTITASAPMSGPYSLSEKMFEFTLGDEAYPTVAYLVSVVLSMQEAYGNIFEDGNLGQLFKEEYLPLIDQYIAEEIGLFTMNDAIVDMLTAEVGASLPKFMFKDEVREEVFSNPDYPINVALRDNDLHDWKPEAPTILYYCTQDEQVWFENALFAETTMKANGAENVSSKNMGEFTHGGCVFPAVVDAIIWFAGFQDITADTEDLIAARQTFKLFPNPSHGETTLVLPSDDQWQISVYDLMGRLIFTDDTEGSTYQMRLDAGPGSFFINANNGQFVLSKKLILH